MEFAGDRGEFKNFMEGSDRLRNFLIGVIVSGLLAWAFSYTPWPLVIIAGIIAGLLNENMRRGSLSGLLGVGLSWLGIMLYGGFTNNAFLLLDQFGSATDGYVSRDLTLDEMAARIGSTREMVCKILYQFSGKGIIDIHRTELKINAPDQLQEIADKMKG